MWQFFKESIILIFWIFWGLFGIILIYYLLLPLLPKTKYNPPITQYEMQEAYEQELRREYEQKNEFDCGAGYGDPRCP